MNKEQIKNEIEKLNRLIQESADFTTFTLNKDIVGYYNEINSLQKICEISGHKYINNVCEYCSITKKWR